MIILKIYRNYLRTLETIRTSYNNFKRGENRLVKVRRNLDLFRTKVKKGTIITSSSLISL